MTILIKVGSALISRNNRIAVEWLRQKIREISNMHADGYRFVLVSSGAVAAGMEERGIIERPTDTLKLQMLSGEGQMHLMKYYHTLFRDRGIYTAQILLTHHNFRTRQEEATLSAIIAAYLDDGVIPIINENDMVNKEEVSAPSFTDNDILAALVATKLKVKRAVILTDVDGLYSSDPKNNSDVGLIRQVPRITDEIYRMASIGKSRLGLGGMLSKIKAADMITAAGIETIVANGNYPLQEIINGEKPSTVFIPAERR